MIISIEWSLIVITQGMMFPQIYKGHLIFCQVYKCLTDMMFVIILPKLINVNNKHTSLHVIHIYNKSAVKKIHIISYQHIKKSYMYLFQNVYRYNSLVHICKNFVFISIMFIVKIYIYIYINYTNCGTPFVVKIVKLSN